MDYLQAAKDAKYSCAELDDDTIEFYDKSAPILAYIAIAEQVARLVDAAERIADALKYKPFYLPAALAQQTKEQMQSD